LLLGAVQQAGLAPALNNSQAVMTIFAPTDDAINKGLEAMGIDVGQLIGDQQLLRNILNYHAINGTKLTPTNLTLGQGLRTDYEEKNVTVVGLRPLMLARGAGGQNVTVNRTVDAGRSIVYVIDSWLVPEDLDPSAGAATNTSSTSAGSTQTGGGSPAPASPPPALPPPSSGSLAAAAFGLPLTFSTTAVSAALALVAVGVFLM